MNVREIEPFLLDKLFSRARPIADACAESRSDMRLSDMGQFLLAAEAFGVFNHQRLHDTLLTVLDEFAVLDRHAYHEQHLWSIVYLSRLDLQHVETFWPLAIALDLRYRPAPWKRSANVAIVDQPYRFTELLFYYYAINTLQRLPRSGGLRRYRSLAACVNRLQRNLSGDEQALMIQTLRDLASTEKRPVFGDAAGLLLKPKDDGPT
ncbi:MAG: hypothetical protein K2R98_14980 [Gemmataceae bacterium]|nr:hypothetical protein [Gemmataceae bacterium]